MPPKHENGGKKMQKWGQKAPSKQQSDGKKRHHSDKREKKPWWRKVPSKWKVVAENATKTVKVMAKSATISVIVVVH